MPPKPVLTRREAQSLSFTFSAVNDSTRVFIYIIQTNTPEAVLIRGLCDNIYPPRCTLHDLEPDNQYGVVLNTCTFPKPDVMSCSGHTDPLVVRTLPNLIGK